MFTLKVLGEAVGVQYQGIVDRTTSNSFANALGVGLITGRFKRGRTDKPMLITPDTIRGRLGYEPNNPSYQAVQSVLDAGVPSVWVLRISETAPVIVCTPSQITIPAGAAPNATIRIYYTLNNGPQLFWESSPEDLSVRDVFLDFIQQALSGIVVGSGGGIGAFQYYAPSGSVTGGSQQDSVDPEPVQTILTLDIAPNTNTAVDLINTVFGEQITLTACANVEFMGF